MKRMSIMLGTLLIVSMLLAACGAEETSTAAANTKVPPVTVEATMTEAAPEMTETPAGTAGAGTTTPGVPVTGENSTSRVSNLLDYDVWNQNGEQVGEVEDMVLDMDNSSVSYVVIETGGFLDIGDKTLLVPWDSLELQTPVTGGQENAFVLTMDQEMLDNAPDVDLDSVLPAMGQPDGDWDADIRNFWENGAMPSATQATGNATATPTVGTGNATVIPAMTATTSTGPLTGQDKLQGVLLATDVIGSTITLGQEQAMGQSTAVTAPLATATTSTETGTGTVTAPAPNTSVDTGNGPTEATVEDIIIDPKTGDINYLVLSSDFSDDQRWIPVPLSTLRWDANNNAFLFVPDANALQNAPFFQPDQFPDTTVDGWDTNYNDFWHNFDLTSP